MDCAEDREAGISRARCGIGRAAAVQCPGAQTDYRQRCNAGGDRHIPHADQDFPSPPFLCAPPGAPVPESVSHRICQMRQSWCGSRIKKIFCEAFRQHFVKHCAGRFFRDPTLQPPQRTASRARTRFEVALLRQLHAFRLTARLRGHQSDLFRFVDHRRLSPFEGEVEELLPRDRIGGSFRLQLVMDRRFETQAWTAMPPDHATPSRQQNDGSELGQDFRRDRD